MRTKIIALVVAIIGAGALSMVLAIAGMIDIVMTRASEDMTNWERWNDNDDRI